MHVTIQSSQMKSLSDYLYGQAVRSLDILRDIDGTIEGLVLIRKHMDAFSETAIQLIKGIEQRDPNVPFAPEAAESLEGAQVALHNLHKHMAKAKHAIVKLHVEDDCILDAYEQCLIAVAHVNNDIERLRNAVLEHNVDAEGEHKPVVMSDIEKINQFLDDL